MESFRNRGFAIGLEISENVDPGVTSAADAFRLLNGSSSIEGDVTERELDRSTFGHNEFTWGNERVIVEGDFEIIPPADPGAGTSAGNFGVERLLRISGFAAVAKSSGNDTSIHKLVSSSIPSAYMLFWHSGTLKEASGARADISSLGVEIGSRFKGRAKIQGTSVDLTEAALPTDFDYSAQTVPVVARKDNTIIRYITAAGAPVHLYGKSLLVDFNNEVQTKEYSQFGSTAIGDRKPLATLRIAKPSYTALDARALRAAGTIVGFDVTVIEADGRYLRLKVRGQLEGFQDVDIDKDFGHELAVRCIPSDAGGDEVELEAGIATLRLLGTYANGDVGTAYSSNISTLGAPWTAPVYSVLSGSIPAGLTLNTATGALTGTPTTANSYTFVIRASYTNAAGATVNVNSASQTVTIA